MSGLERLSGGNLDLTGGTLGQVLTARGDGKYGPATVGKYDAARQIYNVNADSLRRWRAARAKSLIGADTAEAILFGDSISLGNPGATPGSTDIMTQLQGRLASFGFPSAGTSYYYIGDTVHWAVTGSPSRNNSSYTTLTSAMTATFDPGQAVGSFDLVYVQHTAAGSFTYAVDGGSPVTVNGNGSVQNVRIRIDAGSVGTHTLTVAGLSGNSFIVKVAGNSARPNSGALGGIRLNVHAAGGRKIGDITTVTDATSQMPNGIAGGAKLALIMLETNDYISQTALATYTASLTSAVTYLQGQGLDVVLLTTMPPSDTTETITLAQYTAAIYGVADALNCAVVDLAARFKTYAISQPLGFYYDVLHGNPTGYADIGTAIVPLLAA